jgi:GT2 family glycosyltransferase
MNSNLVILQKGVHMDLSIIIVNYQTYDLTKETIESVINKNHPFTYEIYLVDDASQDGSLEKLQEDFKEQSVDGLIKFIASPENKGFAHANNLSLKQAKARYVLLLNSDTVILITALLSA